MRDLPILLRLPDGTQVDFKKLGGKWHATDRGSAQSGMPRYMPEMWLHAALDEIVRLSGESAGHRERWIHADARLQTKEPT